MFTTKEMLVAVERSTQLDLIDAQPAGARFYRADLHIHSFGASPDVKDNTMTPQAIVQTAKREGLELIAVTDHDVIANVEAAIAAGDSEGVLVLPGLELSTPEGHLLVYCRTFAILSRFYGTLKIADAGTQDSRCKTSMLECLELLPAADAIAVLAHVDAKGGLEDKVPGFPPHKQDIFCHPALAAVEVVSATSDFRYNRNDPVQDRAQVEQLRRKALGESGRHQLGRLLSSDSHTLSALGRNAKGDRRVSRVKMDTPSFDALRIALQDADARVRLEDEIPTAVPYIRGLAIEGGFLQGTSIQFSRNLNCIIGGRGAGKSTAFESVRALTNAPSGNKVVDSEVWAETLGCAWLDQAGARHHLTRRHGERPRNADKPDEEPVVIGVDCYGQGETASTSQQAQRDPLALLAYLDRFVDGTEHSRRVEELRQELLENQTDIENATQKVASIPHYEKLLGDAKRQLATLETAKAKEIISFELKVAEERAVREQIAETFRNLPGSVDRELAESTLKGIYKLADPTELKVGVQQFVEIVKEATLLADQLATASKSIKLKLAESDPRVARLLADWTSQEKKVIDQIDEKRRELEEQGVKLDMGFIRKLATDKAQHEKSLNNLRAWKPHLDGLTKKRGEILSALQKTRTEMYGERLRFAKHANDNLGECLHDLTVRVKLAEGAWSPDGERIVQDAMDWRTIQVPKAHVLLTGLTMAKLLDCVKRRDPQPIRKIKSSDGSRPFSDTESDQIVKRLSEPTHLFALERCEVHDLPKITVTKRVVVDGVEKYLTRDFAKLSLGQQQSVLLALMLSSDSNRPLLIDQPEDNLDSEFVFGSLVPVLRRAKERRQVIIVTHNANIAVLGDAELIIAIKSLSDRGAVVQRGSIDSPDVRTACCQILEGSTEAFAKRARIYGVLSP